ncbi:substrate-binding domain-containing protein [Streptomyces sp. NPDC059629]|uniref:substrate-binding domain-containing protein n=1 Tax=Streptomyces sp. NPDC059629 TaxID=3346889 RepID=UPI0036947ACC
MLHGERTGRVEDDVVQTAARMIGLLQAVDERPALDRHAAAYGVHAWVGGGEPGLQDEFQGHAVARRAGPLDGIIVTGRRTDPRPPLTGIDPAIPVAYALSPSTDPADTSVVTDDRGGARLAVEHLPATGRTRTAHVTGPEHHQAARDRARHAVEHLAGAGLELATRRVHFGEWSKAWGRRAADAVLRTAPDTDAVFCGNDQIARDVADALRERGKEVPGDIAVVGYDNWDTMALACRPPFTTVDMNLAEIGRIAALRLLQAIDAEPDPGVHTVPCRLVVRESS